VKKLFLISLLVAFSACNDIEDCDTDENLDFFILRFYDIESQSAQKVAFEVTSEVSNADETTIFLYGDCCYFSDSTGIALPLNPDAGLATFQFDSVGADVSYSLTVSYETNVSIFDEDCPPSFFFTALDSVNYTFDSLAIPVDFTTRQLITTTTVNPNVEVYF